MGRIVSGNAVTRAAVAAALFATALGLLRAPALALDVPEAEGSATRPATTQPATSPATAPSSPSSQPTTAASPSTQPGPNGHIVQKGDLTLEIRGDGVFLPDEAYELRPVFKAYGGPMQIVSIAPPNAKVKKGDSLLECDTTGINWAILQAEGDLAGAKANLQKAASDVALGVIGDQMALKGQEDAVRIVEQTRKWFDDLDGPHMLKRADLMVKATQDSADDQNDELDQLRKMYKDEELTSATADIVVKRAVRNLDMTRTLLKMQEQVRDKVKQFDYVTARQRATDAVDAAKQTQALTKAQLAQSAVARQSALTGAKIAFEQMSKRLADLREDLNWYSVKAPCDGVVAYGTLVEGQWVGGDPRALKPGERIGSGQIVLRVYTPGKMHVAIGLPESQALWVEAGMKAKVTPAALPQHSYQATCKAVEVTPRGNPGTVGFQLMLEAGEVDPRLLPGMRASVQIDAGRVEGAVLVPVAAVTAGKVQVRDKDGSVTSRSVEVGKSDGQQVEIRSGLKEGEEIVLPGKKG